jgi:hypothetical protein
MINKVSPRNKRISVNTEDIETCPEVDVDPTVKGDTSPFKSSKEIPRTPASPSPPSPFNTKNSDTASYPSIGQGSDDFDPNASGKKLSPFKAIKEIPRTPTEPPDGPLIIISTPLDTRPLSSSGTYFDIVL